MKIFDGIDVDKVTYEELDSYSFLINKWYVDIDTTWHHIAGDTIVSYFYVKGHLDYMESLINPVPPATEYDGAFYEYTADDGYVYVTLDSYGKLWNVFYVRRVPTVKKSAISSGQKFQEDQWASMIDGAQSV